MVVQKGTGFYHVEAAATNRTVSFQIATTPNNVNSLFVFLKGNNAFHPWTGQIASPTVNQKIAQYRVDYIVRALTIYAIPLKVQIVDLSSHTGNGVQITFETLVSNVLPNGSDIADTLGMADRATKTKAGLQTLATALLTTASLDGGSTLLFAINPNLSDGTTTTAPAITGLTVTSV